MNKKLTNNHETQLKDIANDGCKIVETFNQSNNIYRIIDPELQLTSSLGSMTELNHKEPKIKH